MFCLVLLCAVAASVHAQRQTEPPHSFKDFKLIRINPSNEENLKYLEALYEGQSPYELDFWQPPTHVGALVDVSVAPSDAPIFVKDLSSKNLKYIVAINDLEKAIQNERSNDAFHHPAKGFSYERYNALDEIHDEMMRLKKSHPKMITLIDIGSTYENRTLLVMKLTGNQSIAGEKIPMWIDAGIHAREWIAPATAMYTIKLLLEGYENDAKIQNLLDNIEFYILPVMNPDGYEYSRTTNRMWRKNRRPAQCKRNTFHTVCCGGVDLNRNFDWFWASRGSSTDPCHETYHGPSAFSEPESQSVKDFLEAHRPKAFITMHSYSQMWLIPFGHRKRSYPQDYHTALKPLALRATEALFEKFGTKYQVGTGADMMYEAAGGSHDWAKGNLKVPYAYLIELRPKNTMFGNGFLLPEREIPSTGVETFEAIKVVAEEIIGQFIQPKIRTLASKTTDPVKAVTPLRRGYKVIETTTKTPTTLVGDTTTVQPTTEVTTTTERSTTSEATTEATTTTEKVVVTETTTEEQTTSTEQTTTSTEESTTRTEATPTSTSTEEVVTDSSTGGGKAASHEEATTPRLLECHDYGSYCQLWGVLNLCERRSVQKLCAKTCVPSCKKRVL